MNVNGSKTHCRKGHEYTEENTWVETDPRGYTHRHCRACQRLRKDGKVIERDERPDEYGKSVYVWQTWGAA